MNLQTEAVLEKRELSSPTIPDLFELSIIGSMLSDTSIARNIATTVEAELFGSPRNRLAYITLRNAALLDTPISLEAAISTIDNAPESMDFYGFDSNAIREHLEYCISVCDPPASWPHYARQIELLHAQRSMLGAFDQATADAMQAPDAAGAVSSVLQRVIDAASKCSYANTDEEDKSKKFMRSYQSEESGTRIRFPQDALNTVGGFRAPNVIVVSAYTGGYKSWVASDWAISSAKQNKRVRFYPLEMGWEETYERFMGIHCGIDVDRLIEQKTPKDDVEYCLDEVLKLPIDVIMDKSSPNDIMADILSTTEKPDIVVIDHIQLLKLGNDIRVSLDKALSDFKQFARQHNIVFILVSQLSRPENRRDLPEPTLFMLKESGGIEQIADYVIFIHRYIEREYSYEKETFKMWTAKQRNGQPASKFEVEFKDYRMQQRY